MSARTPGAGEGDPQRVPVESAIRQTSLASERTYLAWWRSGLAALALAIGVGRLVPEIADGPDWPYVLIGLGFGAIGVLALGVGLHRHRRVERALEYGGFAPMPAALAVAMTVAGVLFAVGVVLVIALGG